MSVHNYDTFKETLPNRLDYTEIEGKQVEAYKAEITRRMKRKQRRWTAVVTVGALILTILFVLVAFLAAAGSKAVVYSVSNSSLTCNDMCSLQIIETIPSGMEYDPGSPKHPAIVDKLKEALHSATKTIDIASSYWTLRGSDVKGGPYPMAKVGEEIFDGLIDAATTRGDGHFLVHILCTVNSRLSPHGGLFCVGYFLGGAYSRGAY